MDLTQEQLAELVSVFQAESAEHVKAITEIFLALEKGDEDIDGLLTRAFREAHSLKGAAGTLGFGRVEVLTHRLEDVIGMLSRGEKEIDTEIVDQILGTMDIIAKTAVSAKPGDDVLSTEEAEQVMKLEALLGKIDTEVPEDVTEVEAKPRKPTSLLPPAQLEHLTQVFRAEAVEHVKALAEVFFALEEGSGDVRELLTRAFREAHSLKGSSATLGFTRIELLTHHLEDALGHLSRTAKKVLSQEVDLLLNALDTIRRAVDSGELGNDDLSEEEQQIATSLEVFASKLAGARTKKEKAEVVVADPEPQKSASDTPTPPKEEKPSVPSPEKIAAAAGKEPKSSQPVSTPAAGKARDEFIRIQESKIEAVFAQVAELFEANLQIESLSPDLNRFCTIATETTGRLEALLREFEGTEYEADLYPIVEKARNLSIQLGATSKRFDQDERQLSKMIQGAQEELRKIRLAPVSTIFIMIRRQVREISKITGKRLELYLGGGEYAVDRKVLDAIEEPLIHVLRNAASHGIEDAETRVKAGKSEAGRIRLDARHTGDAVEISVADDGRGIDPEKIRRSLVKKRIMPEAQAANLSNDQLFDNLFASGFSTKEGVSKISGRGVGLDVVKYTVERLGGEVRLESRVNEGTAITLRMPLAMSTVRCLLLRIAGRVLAIPASNVEKVIVPTAENTKVIGGGEVIDYKDQNIPFGSLGDLLGLASKTEAAPDSARIAVIISFGERRFAFAIEELIEYTQLILKPLGDLLERVPNISGISLLGSGEIALVLNPSDLVRAAGGVRKETSQPIFQKLDETLEAARVLVVDDSIATRTLEKTLLESAGFSVLTASDGYKALDVLASNRCDLVVSDVQMPNMDGFELARTIKSRSQFAHLPVILVTSLGSDEDKARGLAAGADAYIVKKELTQGELVDTIHQLL